MAIGIHMTQHDLDGIIDNIIKREGGFVAHPNDPGGPTKFGISQRAYPNEDIPNLTPARARFLYNRDYAAPLHIINIDWPQVGEILLDWFINGGFKIKEIQKLVGVKQDGNFGPATIKAINTRGSALVRPLLYLRLFHYINLTKHPFIKGWVSRLIELGL